MTNILRGRYGGLIEGVLIFLVAAVVYGIIFFRVPWFMAIDDVHVHTIRAASYIWNIDVPFPVTTVFAREGVGFYQLYYLLHVPFFVVASLLVRGGLFLREAPPLDVLFVGAKLFHMTLIAAFYATMYSVTRHMYGRRAGLISLFLLFTASDAFQARFFIMRPHTLASLLFLLFVMGLIWRRYALVFITAVTTVLAYTVSFMLIIPALLVSVVERRAALLAVTLGGLIVGIALHPLGLEYVNYAWLTHILSAALTALDLHPASPGEFNSVSAVVLRGSWMICIFSAIILCLLRPKAAQDFLHDRRSAELLVITVLFVPLMMLSPRGSEYFIPIFCVLMSGFLVHVFGPKGRTHNEGSEREIRMIGKMLLGLSFILAVFMFFGWYRSHMISFDSRQSFKEAQCAGEGRVYSRDFGDYVYFTMANPKLQFLTGIDPMFTVVDPEYGKYAETLFGMTYKTLDELLPTLRELKTDYIVTSLQTTGWEGDLYVLIKDKRLQPVCLVPGARHMFFKILP